MWKVHYHGDDLAQITHRLEVSFFVFLAVRNDDLSAHASCVVTFWGSVLFGTWKKQAHAHQV